MLVFLLRRVLQSSVVLLVMSLLVFVGIYAVGDPLAILVSPEADPAEIERTRVALGLDQPLWTQYLIFLRHALTGDFGNSFSNRPVTTVIGSRLFNTLKLAALTAAIAVPMAIFLGTICARYRNRPIDRFLSAITLASISLPEFFIAYVLMLLLATNLHLFPTLSSIRGSMDVWEQLYRMAMPILTLMFVTLAHMMRNTRAALIGIMSHPYIEMARLKGEPEMRIVLRHALPNAIGPIASVVAINLAYLIAGVVVVEVVFVYPGIGQTMVDAVRNRDVPVVQACALIFAATYIILNLVADLVSIVSNPRLLHPR